MDSQHKVVALLGSQELKCSKGLCRFFEFLWDHRLFPLRDGNAWTDRQFAKGSGPRWLPRKILQGMQSSPLVDDDQLAKPASRSYVALGVPATGGWS